MTEKRSQKVRPDETDPRRIATAINQSISGRTDNYGSLTLTASTAQTVVATSGLAVSVYSTITMTPTTANAAAEMGAGTLYVSAKANGSFTLAHASNAQTDRTFDYAWIG